MGGGPSQKAPYFENAPTVGLYPTLIGPLYLGPGFLKGCISLNRRVAVAWPSSGVSLGFLDI
jgi:hypothetical protein